MERSRLTSPSTGSNHIASAASTLSSRSLTSIDLKKSRARPTKILNKPISSTPIKSVVKSSSFTAHDVKPSPIPEFETMTLDRKRSDIPKTKLILRVPSIASEYENKRVFYSVRVDEEDESKRNLEGNDASNVTQTKQNSVDNRSDTLDDDVLSSIILKINENCEKGDSFNKNNFGKCLSDSTTNLVPVTPRNKQKFRHRDFSKAAIINTISHNDLEKNGIDLHERLRPPLNGFLTACSSDVGSTSLSNFSSGDGLSTSTPMGSTTRLIYNQTHSKKWKNSWSESITTTFSILSLVGNLGNILRLPRMVFFHGGGIFLLVYVILTLLIGLPLTFLEIGLGQFCQHGTTKLWRACNFLRGVGYVKVLISCLAALYYMSYSALSFSLLTWSSKGPLPFSECHFADENGTSPMSTGGELCLKRTFLQTLSNDGMWFGVNVMFLLVLWSLVFLSVIRRNHTYRRAVFFSFPPVVIVVIALLVEASSRSTNGLYTLLKLEWTQLFNVELWYFATVQMFFSLQLGFGNINTCAGRIYPKNNAFWAAASYVLCNVGLGIITVILSYLWLGQLEESGIRFTVTSVPETFFLLQIYDVASTCMASLPRLWSSLAYLAVTCAGFSSVIAFVYTILVAVAVESKRRWHWWHVAGTVCLSGFVLGLFSMIPNYLSVAHILDHYVISRTVVMATVLELVGFAWIYGCKNVYNDLEFVIGERLCSFWKVIWTVAPVYLLVIEIWSAATMPLVVPEDDTWMYSLGWSLYFFCWLIVIIVAMYQIYIQVDYNIKQKFLSSIKPSRNWGPVDPIYRHCWVQWRNRYNLTGQKDFSLKRRGTKDYTHSVRTATEHYDSHSTTGVNPSATTDWTFKRTPNSSPYVLDTRNDHVCWRKDGR